MEKMVRFKPLKAVIFDLDGTLIDNEGVYERAFCAVLKKRGISCEAVSHTPGIGVKENWEKMVNRGVLSEDPQTLTAETYDFYLNNLTDIIVRPGVREVMHYLIPKGLGVEVVGDAHRPHHAAGDIGPGGGGEDTFDPS